ncbi:ParB/RepB/Spo0J family partition protein [Streptomyces sp. 846.5]|nr:ParB N-terminal domain-containing protein [Streptomyces sp. 846.5]TDT93315.1 ParB/RepB/Spo0J family partition protein [Streptomyces sp. 846.5]
MSVTTKPSTWPTVTVAGLIAHPGNVLPQADAELTADIAANGITDPLHIVTTSTGVQQVMDGMRRLAAALAAGLESVPFSPRAVIRLADLTPHPDNPRESLNLTSEFVATFAAEGCVIPVKFRTLADGTRQIVDGHRRFFAAKEAGLTHVPYELDELDDASTYVEMVVTATHRTGLTDREEAAALFSAAEAGAGVKRLATAAGTSQKAVKASLNALRSASARRAEAAAGGLDLTTMAALADLEARDAEAAEKVAAELEANPKTNVEWAVRRAGVELDQRDKLAAHRAELEARGARLRTEHELSDKASSLYYIQGDTSAHETQCQGHVWVLKSGATQYTAYCANTEVFGHTVRDHDGRTKVKTDPAERKRVISGNLDWDTAEQQRREWIATLLKRRALPRATADRMASIAALAMLCAGQDSMSDRCGNDKASERLAEMVGGTKATVRADLAKRWGTPKDAARLAFAVTAAAYESYIGRQSWRDGSAVMRTAAAQWLAWLTELGYEPAAVEIATRDGKAYKPVAKAAKGQKKLS